MREDDERPGRKIGSGLTRPDRLLPAAFSHPATFAVSEDAERLKNALFLAGPQWGDRSPEDIIAAIDAAGFTVVPKKGGL